MTLPVVSLLFFGSGVIVITVFVLLKRRDELSRSWLYFGITVSLYAFGTAYFSNNYIDPDTALVASRIATTSASIIPLTWFHFVSQFLNIRRNWIYWIVFPLSFVFIIFGMTELFIPSVAPVKGYYYYPTPGPIYYFHVVNFIIVVSYGFFLMVRSFLKETNAETRKEIFSLFLATLVGFIAGSSEFSLILLRDKGFDLTAFIFLYPLLMAYAMIRHRALDIEKIADAFQREKLAAIGILSAGFQHQLKNPLLVMRGNLELCFRKTSRQDGNVSNEEMRPLLQKAMAQADRAVELMERLKELARPADQTGQREKIPVQDLFERVLEVVEYQFKLEKVNVVRQFEEGLILIGNARQLEEVLFNLIVNAYQAMPEGGTLFLAAASHKEKTRIEIRDSGKGIGTLNRGKVFQPFHSTKEKEGTGLGLYITKQLVERNGGKIWFETSPQSTRFFLEFSK